MANPFGSYFSYVFADFELSTDGDIVVDNNDFSVIGGDDLQLQEINLIFRNKINPKEFMGFSTSGSEGQAIGDMLKERIWIELQSNSTIDSSNLYVDVIPLPDNKMKIEISRIYDDNAVPMSNGFVNFTDGTIEGMSQRQLSISDVYDVTTSIPQTEIIVTDKYTNMISIKHPLVANDALFIFNSDDNALSGNTTLSTSRSFVDENLSNVILYAYELFAEVDQYNTIILSISAVNENNEALTITIDDDMRVRLGSDYGTDYNDIIINITYRTPVARSINQNILSNSSIMMIDTRMLFPYSRFFGKINIVLDNVLEPGTYIASYNRYRLK